MMVLMSSHTLGEIQDLCEDLLVLRALLPRIWRGRRRHRRSPVVRQPCWRTLAG